LQNICVGLLNNIVLWGDTFDELYKRVKRVFKQLAKYGLMLNTKNSVIYVEKGVFLGFVISIDGVIANPDKITAIRDRPMPGTTIEIRAFVNAAGYF
jgi:hypothetical protein